MLSQSTAIKSGGRAALNNLRFELIVLCKHLKPCGLHFSLSECITFLVLRSSYSSILHVFFPHSV